MGNPIKSGESSIFVQKQDGGQVYYLGECFGFDSMGDVRPGKDPIICWRNGKLQIVGKKQTPPSLLTFTIDNLLEKAANWLDVLSEQECPFTVFALFGCNELGVFNNNPQRGYVLGDVEIVDGTVSPIRVRDADDEVVTGRDMVASSRVDAWEITASQKATSETEDANSVTASPGNCLSDCGNQIEVCEELWVGCDAVGAGTANVLRSQDGGVTWAATAADPFAADENIVSIRAFQLNGTTVRVLCVRDGDAAAALEIAYTDDYGATWTNVTVGATNNEAGVADQSLFVLDASHIWLCTDDGRVFFSGDAGVTWTDQASALVASGANALNAIAFIDTNVGYAVGDGDTVIYTVDGGQNWVAGTATGGGQNLDALAVFSQYRILTGDDTGDLYMTYDQTTNWTAITDWTGAGTGAIENLKNFDDEIVYMIHTDASTDGRVLRSLNGGYSFDRIGGYVADTAGLNAVHVCTPNHVFAVGDDDGSTAVIAEGGTADPS